MTDSSSPDSSPASRNTFAHHLGMKGFLLMEGLLKLVGMKTLYRLGRTAAVQKQPPVMIRKLIDQVFQFFLIVNFVHFSSYSHAEKFYILTIFFCIGIF